MKWFWIAVALTALAASYHFVRYGYVSHSLFAVRFYVRDDRLTGERCVFLGSPELARRLGLAEC